MPRKDKIKALAKGLVLAKLAKTLPPMRFPKMGLGDDRRETPIVSTPDELNAKLRHQASYATRQMEAHTAPEQRSAEGFKNTVGKVFEDLHHTRKQTSGAAMVGPEKTTISYAATPDAREVWPWQAPSYEFHNNASVATREHENFHLMMNRVQQKHGLQGRKQLASNLLNSLPAEHRNHMRVFMQDRYPMDVGHPMHNEEMLAIVLNYLNNPGERNDYHKFRNHTPEQSQAFQTHMKQAYHKLWDTAKNADDSWATQDKFREVDPEEEEYMRRKGLKKGEPELAQPARRTRKPKAAAPAPEKNLVVVHNLSADNLHHAHKLGGLAAPSLAIVHHDQPLTGFGEISLVGGHHLVDPERGVPVFGADVYSPRHPRTKYRTNDKELSKLKGTLAPYAERTKAYLGDLPDELEDKGAANVAQWKLREPLGLMFLEQKGHKFDVAPELKPIQYEFVREPAFQEFIKQHGIDYNARPGNFEEEGENGEYWKHFSQAVKDATAQHAHRVSHDAETGEHDPDIEKMLVDAHNEQHFGEDGKVFFGHGHSILRSAEHANTVEVNPNKVREAVRTKLQDYPEFDQWAHEVVKPSEGERYIPKYLNSGGVRKIPYNLDNILKEVTKKVRQGENFNYGLGTARAGGAKKFRNLDEIGKHRQKIVSTEDFKKIKEEMDNRYGGLAQRLSEFHQLHGDQYHGMRTFEALAEAIGESYKKGHSLSRELKLSGYENVPLDLQNEVAEFARDLVAMPTEYFEAKPQRIVGLNEFHGAAIPENAHPSVEDVLKQNGIQHIERYKKDDAKSRSEAIKRISGPQNLALSEVEDGTETLFKASEPDFDWESIQAKIAKDNARVTELAAQPHGHVFGSKWGPQHQVVVHIDPKEQKWRTTHFDDRGPTGHGVRDNKAEALKLAMEYGADIHSPLPEDQWKSEATDGFENLAKVEGDEITVGRALKTSQPVSLTYYHSRSAEPTAHYGERFGQHVEPHGQYMGYHSPAWGKLEDRLDNEAPWRNVGYEYGTVHFKNPIVVDGENTREWKEKLSAAHGGKRNKALSNHLTNLGHDGVIARGPDGRIHEMVNLSAEKDITKPLPSQLSMRKADPDLLAELNAPDDEILRLLGHQNISERKMALKLAGVQPRHLKSAMSDRRGGLDEEVFHHPAMDSDTLNWIVQQKHIPSYSIARMLEHPLVTPEHLETAWNAAKDRSSDFNPTAAQQKIVDKLIFHPKLSSDLIQRMMDDPDGNLSTTQADFLLSHPNMPERKLREVGEFAVANPGIADNYSEAFSNPKMPPDILERGIKTLEYGKPLMNIAQNPSLPEHVVTDQINQELAGAGRPGVTRELMYHPKLTTKHIDDILAGGSDDMQTRMLAAQPKALEPRHIDKILDHTSDSPTYNQSQLLMRALQTKAVRPEHIDKLLAHPHPSVRGLALDDRIREGNVNREHISKLLKDPSGYRVSRKALSHPLFDEGHISQILTDPKSYSSDVVNPLVDRHADSFTPEQWELLGQRAPQYLSRHQVPSEVLDKFVNDPKYYTNENYAAIAAEHPNLSPASATKLAYHASPMVAENLSLNPKIPANVVDHFIDGPEASLRNNLAINHKHHLTPAQIDRMIDKDEYVRSTLASHPDLTADHIRKLYKQNTDPNSVESLLEHPHTPTDILHDAILNYTKYDNGEAIMRQLSHPNISPKTLEILRDNYHKDTGIHEAAVKQLQIHHPDSAHKESVRVKFDTNKLRKIRDHIRGQGLDQISPKQLPPGNWAPGRLPNGNISANKIDEYINAQPEQRYNISHDIWEGAQRHSATPSKVLQVNFTSDHVRKMKEAGVWGAFRKMYDAYSNTNHPVTPSTIGWVRYTDNSPPPHDEIESGLPDSPTLQAEVKRVKAALKAHPEIQNLQGNVDHHWLLTDKYPNEVSWHGVEASSSQEPIERIRQYVPDAFTYERLRPPATPAKPGVFIDEIQSDFGQSFGKQAAGQARHKAEEDAKRMGLDPDAAKNHINEYVNKVTEKAKSEWPEDDYQKISNILFQGRKPNEVLAEAFVQHHRDTGKTGTPVHIHTIETKAPISGLDRTKAVPGHFNFTYNELPKKLGMEPAKYGELGTESNEKHKDKPVQGDVIRKFEDDLQQFLTGLAKAEPNPSDQENLKAMLGHDDHIKACFEAARWLANAQEKSPDEVRQALYDTDEDPEEAALALYGLPIDESNFKALRAVRDLSALSKAEPEPVSADSVEPGHPDANEVAAEIKRAFDNRFVLPVQLNGKHSGGSLLARDEETGKVWLLKPGVGKQAVKAVREESASQSQREAAFHHVVDSWGLDDYYPHTELLNIDGRHYAAIALLPWSFRQLKDIKAEQGSAAAQQILAPYLKAGILHKWAAVDFILGNADRHAGNVLTRDGRIFLIDAGSSMAGSSFSPATDPATFTPYYLRAWAPGKFSKLTPEEKLKYMPRIDRQTAEHVGQWLQDLDQHAMERILKTYGINPAPAIERLASLKAAAQHQPIDEAVNRAWVET